MLEALFDWVVSTVFHSAGEKIGEELGGGFVDAVKSFPFIIGILVVLAVVVGYFRFRHYWAHNYSLHDGELVIYKTPFTKKMFPYRHNKVRVNKVDGTWRFEIHQIGAPWFVERNTITSIIISDGVTNISSAVFAGFSKLQKISLPDSLVSIGDYAFNDCVSLERVTIPINSDIDDYAFNQCEKLTKVHGRFLGYYRYYSKKHSAHIGVCAFRNCSALTSVEIPAGAVVEDSAFDSHTTVTRREQ